MKKIKILSVLLIIIICVCSITAVSNAASKHTAGEIIDEGKSFIQAGTGAEKISTANLKKMSTTVYNILLITGVVIAAIVGAGLGIKYIMGSVEGKAEIKGMMIPYFVGCFVVFGAFAIWKLVVDVLQSL